MIDETITDKNWLEWTVFAVGCVLVSLAVGYLAYDAIAVTPRPPSLTIRLGEPIAAEEGFALPVFVENRGTEAAEGVSVRVEKRSSDGTREAVDLTLDYVPGEASRRGWVVFSGKPDPAMRFTATPLSYQHP